MELIKRIPIPVLIKEVCSTLSLEDLSSFVFSNKYFYKIVNPTFLEKCKSYLHLTDLEFNALKKDLRLYKFPTIKQRIVHILPTKCIYRVTDGRVCETKTQFPCSSCLRLLNRKDHDNYTAEYYVKHSNIKNITKDMIEEPHIYADFFSIRNSVYSKNYEYNKPNLVGSLWSICSFSYII